MVDENSRTATIPSIMSINDDLDVRIELSGEEAEAFTAFSRLCSEKALLDRPEGLATGDLCDGLIDSTSLLYVIRCNGN
jgi:hypothetical protein